MIDHTTSLEKQVRTLSKRSIYTLFLTWLALFFTIVGIAAGYKNFLRVHDKAKQAQQDAKVVTALMPHMARKAAVENWQQGIRDQLAANQAQATKELNELKSLKASNQNIETSLKQQVEKLTQQQEVIRQGPTSTGSESHWQLAEVHYLLKIANRHIMINRDSQTAMAALKAADQALMELAETRLLPIRGLIAKDIASLQQYQSVDLAAVIETIDALAAQLEKSAQTIQQAVTKSPETVASEKSDDAESSILNRMKARLDQTVVIRRYDNKLAQQIKGDTQQVRFELLRLKFESLKLLALQSKHRAYERQLKQLSHLLNEEHIHLLDNTALAMLGKLESFDLTPAVPDLLAWRLLDEMMISMNTDHP